VVLLEVSTLRGKNQQLGLKKIEIYLEGEKSSEIILIKFLCGEHRAREKLIKNLF